jgi:hypothetical protein
MLTILHTLYDFADIPEGLENKQVVYKKMEA